MANKEIEDLTAVGTLDGTELLVLTDTDGNSRKVALSDLAAWLTTEASIVPESLPWRGARVVRSSNLTGLSNNDVITWNSETVDTDAFWSVGAPTRFTIPSGVTKVRLFWGVVHEGLATAGSVSTLLLLNSGSVPHARTSARQGTTGATSNLSSGYSGAIEVTAGDFFELSLLFSMSGQDQVVQSTNTFFEIEVVEATP